MPSRLGPRRRLRRGPLARPYRPRASGHGLPAQHCDQPAPPRRPHQHRRRPTTSRRQTRQTNHSGPDLVKHDFAGALSRSPARRRCRQATHAEARQLPEHGRRQGAGRGRHPEVRA